MANDDDDLFEPVVFEKSYSEIRDLKARFPEEIVAALAREVLARLAQHRSAFGATRAPVADETIEDLAYALIDSDQDAAKRMILKMRSEGTRDELLYLLFLASAARKLGEWWTEDKITFAQVTTGSGRVYAILRSLKPVHSARFVKGPHRNALFAQTPGDDHSLGIKMAADLMRVDGWDIDLVFDLDHDTLLQRIAMTDPPIIGISAAGAHALPSLAKLVLAIRVWSPSTLILVSGNVVETSRETVALMGVDAMTSNIDTAREELERLWSVVESKS
ncbi:MAG: cobalamin-dependent protein [Litoreibacter sp.]|nr:cobalamin-dependent protein [Litoreibacter sp.]